MGSSKELINSDALVIDYDNKHYKLLPDTSKIGAKSTIILRRWKIMLYSWSS